MVARHDGIVAKMWRVKGGGEGERNRALEKTGNRWTTLNPSAKAVREAVGWMERTSIVVDGVAKTGGMRDLGFCKCGTP